MSIQNHKELAHHIGHKIECVGYGKDGVPPFVNSALECVDCGVVLIDFDVDDVIGVNVDMDEAEAKTILQRLAEGSKIGDGTAMLAIAHTVEANSQALVAVERQYNERLDAQKDLYLKYEGLLGSLNKFMDELTFKTKELEEMVMNTHPADELDQTLERFREDFRGLENDVHGEGASKLEGRVGDLEKVIEEGLKERIFKLEEVLRGEKTLSAPRDGFTSEELSEVEDMIGECLEKVIEYTGVVQFMDSGEREAFEFLINEQSNLYEIVNAVDVITSIKEKFSCSDLEGISEINAYFPDVRNALLALKKSLNENM